jgi:hypothetical protein
MRKSIFAATSIALLTALMVLATPGEARAAQWCSHIRGATNCMYHSHAQCAASVSGRAGTCVRRHR